MKTLLALSLVAVTSSAFAQMGPPPGGPGGMGGPRGSQNANRPSSNRPQQSQSSPTETIRLLGMRTVQSELGITAMQYSTLVGVARSLATTSEEVAFAAVAKVLSTAQTIRLRELLVQDLGYNALSLASVCSALGLTSEQTTQISTILSTVDTAKRATSTASDFRVALRAMASLALQSSAALAKLLTAEQDAKLRALAGKTFVSR